MSIDGQILPDALSGTHSAIDETQDLFWPDAK